jgi:hypothetical protein
MVVSEAVQPCRIVDQELPQGAIVADERQQVDEVRVVRHGVPRRGH